MKNDKIKSQIKAYLPEIITIRHAIHQQPELRYEEIETAKLVADTLRSYGYEPQTGIAKTGVCALAGQNNSGKTVALRADMDALPLTESTGLSYSSKKTGIMHACGHDGHTATLLLVAKVLKQHENELNGKVKFLFQPAEEGGHGAYAMIKEGVLSTPPVDTIFGYHNIPSFKKNKILLRKGCILAGTLTIEIQIEGHGGHSSAPEKAIDPIYIGSTIIQSLQSIVSRNLSPFDPTVISITQFHAGAADNVIPDTATLRGSIRFVNNEAIPHIKEKVNQVVIRTCEAMGGKGTVNFISETPATVNHAQETELVKQTALALWGEHRVEEMPHNLMATEDFSFYLNAVPGCYFLVGTGEDKPYVHDPAYQFDDDIIPVAAELLIMTTLDYLRQK